MDLNEFIETISQHEVFPYTHIMEIPESSLEFAKTLKPDQWNVIFSKRLAIALSCQISDTISIVFSEECYRENILPDSAKVEKGCIILNKNVISNIVISAPLNEKGKIKFSENPCEFGKLHINSKEGIENKEEVYKDNWFSEKTQNPEDKFDRVINLRPNHVGQVIVDGNYYHFDHEYKYLVEYDGNYYFSTDLENLIDAKNVLGVSLNGKNINDASFISDDLFYYKTRDTYSNYQDCRCGLISIAAGELIKNNRYSYVVRPIGNDYFIVNIYNDGNEKEKKELTIKFGLIDKTGKELVPPIYEEIIPVLKEDKTIKIWVQKAKNDKDWMIYDHQIGKLRVALQEDYE
jgi:WG containing repeat